MLDQQTADKILNSANFRAYKDKKFYGVSLKDLEEIINSLVVSEDKGDCPNCDCNKCLLSRFRQTNPTRREIDEMYLKHISSKGRN